VMVRAGVVFTEPSVNESMVEGLVVDPQKKELSRLEVGFELKGDRFEGDHAGGERFQLGHDCSRGGSASCLDHCL
jgi:hypothetical protein